jgi:hypothetical protein
MGDPIGTINNLLQKLNLCEERAKQCSELRGYLNGDDSDRVWKALGIIVISYDEWGEANGTLAAELLGNRL